METKEVIGIDVSKLTLDCCIHGCGLQSEFSNDPTGIDEMIHWAMESKKLAREQVLFILEHTGLYTNQLTHALSAKGCILYIASGLR